jgi:hypothetical protein
MFVNKSICAKLELVGVRQRMSEGYTSLHHMFVDDRRQI